MASERGTAGRWHRRTLAASANVRLAVGVLVWALVAVVAPAAVAENRVALVIGNGEYASKPLRNARHDGELMARTLSDVGFEVVSVLDGDAAAMRTAITDFARRIAAPDTVALFYYAGHGVQADGENYLVPLGADITNMNEVALNAVALGDVLKTMARSESRLNIVILDACRDNPFAGTARAAAQGGLAPVVAPAGTIIGYATAPGQIALDGAGNNSPYTAALAFNMPRPAVTLEEVFRDTRRAVLAATGGAQTPWEHSSLIGAFYFKPAATAAETSAGRADVVPPADARLAEIEAWEKIKDAKDPEVFKAHLAHYPGGIFAELATLRLSKLKPVRVASPWSWVITGSIARGGPEAVAVFERAVKVDSEATTEAERRTAAMLYLEAAEAGVPQAMFQLARALDKGRGIARDLQEAAKWYQRAAEQNHPGAMAALGTMYEFGEGVDANLVEALRLYRVAADAGDAAGMTSLAYLIAEGKGAARNAKAARALYAKAAAKSYPRALFNLALMELRGEGGRRDVTSALEHLETAALKGHVGANEELAALYDEGRAVRKDPRRAADHLLATIAAAGREGRALDVTKRHWEFRTRMELQRQLAARGLYHGGAHGIFDPATRRALASVAQG